MKFENAIIEGSRIGQLRERLGLTQSDFAKEVGLSQGSISEIEKGKARISYDKLKFLHKKYGYSINYHISGDGKLLVEKPDNALSTVSIEESRQKYNAGRQNNDANKIIDENQKLSVKIEQMQLQISVLSEKLNTANEKLILANERYIGLLERTKSSGSQGILGAIVNG